MPIRAIWNNTIIAETDKFMILEGKFYFPPDSVNTTYLKKSGNQYVSRWKGTADYYDIVIGDKINRDAAWAYEEVDQEVAGIRGYFSFWNGVEIIKVNG